MGRKVVTVIGFFLVLLGLLWLGQGLGVIRWPADSFMIGRSTWTVAGACLAVVGAGLVLLARRRARR